MIQLVNEKVHKLIISFCTNSSNNSVHLQIKIYSVDFNIQPESATKSVKLNP